MPEISVIITTYNQEKYIAQAIESVLKQVDCPDFEIIIGNDCSSDNTLKICEEYQRKYPELIKIYPHQTNKGMLGNLRFCFSKCSGDYIAICEGDDYWIDKYKLKKQYEKLSSDDRALFCFTDILLKYEEKQLLKRHVPEIKKKLHGCITLKQQIEYGGPVGNFSCCMFKKEALKYIPESYWGRKGNADWLFCLYLLEKGKGIFINSACSVYRIHNEGLWSGLDDESRIVMNIQTCLYYNELFEFRYFMHFLRFLQDYLNSFPRKSLYNNKKLMSFTFPISKRKKISLELSRSKRRCL